MTDYSNEQNNVFGEVKPQVAESVAPTYQEPVQPQVAEPVVPVYQAPVYQETVPPAQIPVAPTYQAPAEPQPPKKSSAPIIIGILGALLVIALAVILVLALGDKDDSDDKNDKGNKKETEQVDDTDSSEDDDADEDDKTDKGDKDDTNKDDKDNNKGDKNDKNDKNENTDTDINVPVRAGYTSYIDSMCEVFCGNLRGIRGMFPESMWELMRWAYIEELGYLPSVDEVIDDMIGEEEPDDVADYATYEITSEVAVDEETIDLLESGLREFFITDPIEEAYEVHIVWTIGLDGEALTFEDTAYGVCFDGEWTLMSKNYMVYVLDTENIEKVFAGMGESFI